MPIEKHPLLGELVPEQDYCRMRHIKRASAAAERCRGDGPPFYRLGKAIFYPLPELRAWMASRLVRPSRTAAQLTENCHELA